MNSVLCHLIWLYVCVSSAVHGTRYTHYSLKHMLPQHCKTCNDVFLLIILQKCNFSKDQRKFPEDGPDRPKHVGANA
jgi:hypothetical protein